jgi:chemotaxis protein methyltransferase CheR
MDYPNQEIDDRTVDQICRLLNQALGFWYGTQKKYLICSRLDKRLKELNIDDYNVYLGILKSDPAELNRFYDLITTNVTSFFREADHFVNLRQDLLPGIVDRHRRDHKIACWSAGCSSGEEAYTLAMVLSEALNPGWEIKILASDVSIRRLQDGMAGIYHIEKLQGLTDHIIKKYFQKVPERPLEFQVRPELRRKVVFRRINLNEGLQIPSHIRFDMIFCRNVFIYLSNDSRAKIIDGFYSYLVEGGYLFMGHSEAINTCIDPRWLSLKGCIYQKKDQGEIWNPNTEY